jgi:hypothetical protein
MPDRPQSGSVVGMKTPLASTRTRPRRTRRHGPSYLACALAVAGGLAISGCSVATDTPLHVTDVARAVVPGKDILGKVGYPDGRITVTLAPAASPVRDGHRTRGETPCEYHRFSHRFECPTDDLPVGLYLVQVTDAAQPGEGTAEAQVAVTEYAGYDPHLSTGDASGEVTPGPLDLELTGWRPGVTVRIEIVDENATPVFTGSAVPDERGAATLRTTPLERGHYDIDAGDGLWTVNGDEGAYNDAYSGIEVS